MKTNRFLLAVACATMAFTLFACSDDKNDPPITYTYGKGSCYFASIPDMPGVQLCMEFKEDATEGHCIYAGEGLAYTYRDNESCDPPKPVLKCGNKDIGMYWYGTLPAGVVRCEDLDD